MFPPLDPSLLVIAFYVIPLIFGLVIAIVFVRSTCRRAAETSIVPEAELTTSRPVSAFELIDPFLKEYGLSSRECEIALGLYMGKTQSRLAKELNVSRSTVATYCSRIYIKLGIESKGELVALLDAITAPSLKEVNK